MLQHIFVLSARLPVSSVSDASRCPAHGDAAGSQPSQASSSTELSCLVHFSATSSSSSAVGRDAADETDDLLSKRSPLYELLRCFADRRLRIRRRQRLAEAIIRSGYAHPCDDVPDKALRRSSSVSSSRSNDRARVAATTACKSARLTAAAVRRLQGGGTLQVTGQIDPDVLSPVSEDGLYIQVPTSGFAAFMAGGVVHPGGDDRNAETARASKPSSVRAALDYMDVVHYNSGVNTANQPARCGGVGEDGFWYGYAFLLHGGNESCWSGAASTDEALYASLSREHESSSGTDAIYGVMFCVLSYSPCFNFARGVTLRAIPAIADAALAHALYLGHPRAVEDEDGEDGQTSRRSFDYCSGSSYNYYDSSVLMARSAQGGRSRTAVTNCATDTNGESSNASPDRWRELLIERLAHLRSLTQPQSPQNATLPGEAISLPPSMTEMVAGDDAHSTRTARTRRSSTDINVHVPIVRLHRPLDMLYPHLDSPLSLLLASFAYAGIRVLHSLLLYEEAIVFIGVTPQHASACAVSAPALVTPLRWCAPLIPYLPSDSVRSSRLLDVLMTGGYCAVEKEQEDGLLPRASLSAGDSSSSRKGVIRGDKNKDEPTRDVSGCIVGATADLIPHVVLRLGGCGCVGNALPTRVWIADARTGSIGVARAESGAASRSLLHERAGTHAASSGDVSGGTANSPVTLPLLPHDDKLKKVLKKTMRHPHRCAFRAMLRVVMTRQHEVQISLRHLESMASMTRYAQRRRSHRLQLPQHQATPVLQYSCNSGISTSKDYDNSAYGVDDNEEDDVLIPSPAAHGPLARASTVTLSSSDNDDNDEDDEDVDLSLYTVEERGTASAGRSRSSHDYPGGTNRNNSNIHVHGQSPSTESLIDERATLSAVHAALLTYNTRWLWGSYRYSIRNGAPYSLQSSTTSAHVRSSSLSVSSSAMLELLAAHLGVSFARPETFLSSSAAMQTSPAAVLAVSRTAMCHQFLNALLCAEAIGLRQALAGEVCTGYSSSSARSAASERVESRAKELRQLKLAPEQNYYLTHPRALILLHLFYRRAARLMPGLYADAMGREDEGWVGTIWSLVRYEVAAVCSCSDSGAVSSCSGSGAVAVYLSRLQQERQRIRRTEGGSSRVSWELPPLLAQQAILWLSGGDGVGLSGGSIVGGAAGGGGGSPLIGQGMSSRVSHKRVKSIFSCARKMVQRTLGTTTSNHHDGRLAVMDDFVQAAANSMVDLINNNCMYDCYLSSDGCRASQVCLDPRNDGFTMMARKTQSSSPSCACARRAHSKLAKDHLRHSAACAPPACRALPMDALYQFASYHGSLNPMHRNAYTVQTRCVCPAQTDMVTASNDGGGGGRRGDVDSAVAWAAYHHRLARLPRPTPRRSRRRDDANAARRIAMRDQKPAETKRMTFAGSAGDVAAVATAIAGAADESRKQNEVDWHRLFVDPSEAHMFSSAGTGGVRADTTNPVQAALPWGAAGEHSTDVESVWGVFSSGAPAGYDATTTTIAMGMPDVSSVAMPNSSSLWGDGRPAAELIPTSSNCATRSTIIRSVPAAGISLMNDMQANVMLGAEADSTPVSAVPARDILDELFGGQA